MTRRVASPRLVGRHAELAALDEALQRTAKGDGSTVLVAGEAGIGKTRLISAVADDAAGRGFLVLTGGCVELCEGGVPLAPVAEAMRRLRDRVGVDGLVELLGTKVPELGALVPGLLVDDAPADTTLAPPGRLLELLLGLLEHLAVSAPVLFVIEDLHWADRSTLDLVTFLERNLQGPVLMLASVRSDELHRRHPVRPVLAELERSGATVRIDLAPFTRRELGEQIEAITGAPPHAEVVETLFERSEGNPFFTEELLAATTARPDRLPSSLRDILQSRVSHLPDADQETLRLAAAIGVRVDDDLLRRIGGRADDELDQTLRRLVDDNLLEPDREGFRFRHALLQEVVYDELLPGERRRIHAEIAAALSAERPGGAIAAAELAYHWYRARNLPAALEASVEAGLAAERVPAPAEAVRHFERALELWDAVPDAGDLADLDQVELLHHAAEQGNLTGDFGRSIAHLRLALDLVDPATEPVRAGVLHERLGRFLWTADQDGLPEYELALALVPADPPTPERAQVLAGYAQILMLCGQQTRAGEVAQEAVDIARAIGARRSEGHALNTYGTVSVPLGRPDEGLECLHRSLEIATELGILDDVARAYVNLTHSLSQLGRWDELIEVGHEGIDQATRLGLDRTFGVYVESNLLDALLATGAWDEAEERAASIPTRLPVGYWEYFAPCSIFADRGDFDRARELADRLREIPEQSAAIFQGLADYTLGAMSLAIWEDHPEQVAPLMEVVLHRLPDAFLRWRSGELFWRATWAEADRAARGRGTRDDAEVAAAIATADRWHVWVESLVASPADGVLASASLLAHAPLCAAERARADETDQPDDWALAVESLDRFGLCYQVAYARFRRAESILRTGGERALAAAELAAARATTVALRARPLTDEIDRLAKRGRLAPSDSDDEDASDDDEAAAPLGLSPRELQVLRLVADGSTNRQIAERLYISPKTASVHVSNILAKLGVASRGEAAAVAHRLGVTAA